MHSVKEENTIQMQNKKLDYIDNIILIELKVKQNAILKIKIDQWTGAMVVYQQLIQRYMAMTSK